MRVPVRISQLSRDVRDGCFLLAPHAGTDSASATLLELLNSSRAVIPFFPRNDSNVVLLTRAHLEWVAVDLEVAPHLIRANARRVTREQRVELRFLDNRHVEGIVQWDAREDTLRLSDYLNGPDDFFVINTPSGAMIANRSRIVETRLAEVSPRPAQIQALRDLEEMPFKSPSPPA